MAFANTLPLEERLKNDKRGDAMYYTEILVTVVQNSCRHVSHSFLNLLLYTVRDDVVNGILETLQKSSH